MDVRDLAWPLCLQTLTLCRIIHRVDYHRILLDEAIRLGVVLQLGAEVEDVYTEQPAVLLADGKCISADVVIGADGTLYIFCRLYIRVSLTREGQMSTVRKAVLGSPNSPVPTGDMAYRATFSREQLEALGDEKVNGLCQKTAVTSWLGPEKHTIFYPLRDGKEFNLVLMRPDNLSLDSRREQGDIEEMRESYANWDET